MIYFLVGHRGVGKSSLLRAIQNSKLNFKCIDLDAEIEQRRSVVIAKFFQEAGETEFRKLEHEVLKELVSEQSKSESVIIALGAGFELSRSECLAQGQVIWVRRATDSWGRILTGRPLLNSQSKNFLDDYLSRFFEREKMYRSFADTIWLREEGRLDLSLAEEQFLTEDYKLIEAHLTLGSRHLADLSRHLKLHERFEVRTDTMTWLEFQNILPLLPRSKTIISFRKGFSGEWLENIKDLQEFQIDWDLDLGEPRFEPQIISKHEFSSAPVQDLPFVLAAFKKFPQSHLKLCPKITHFKELVEFHKVQKSFGARCSFLPRSSQGKWLWYRLLQSKVNYLNFVSDLDADNFDQPTTLQFLELRHFQTEVKPSQFLAVLGEPIAHSRSPIRHLQLSQDLKMPFFKIEVAANEFNEAFSFLKEMGLRSAAVTSPLKEKAFGVCHQLSLEAKGLGAVNSLWIAGPIVKGHNTDVLGLVDWLVEFDLNKRLTFVWGGGGTLSSLKRLYPEAFYFSVRSGSEREQKAHPGHCEVLIWAAGAHDQAPPVEWKPELVLDLNYRDDSVGRQYAYDCQAVYVSGLDFFQRQAQYQHLFWKDNYERK